MNSTERNTTIIVTGLVGTLLLLVSGAFGCLAYHLTLPDYLSNATITIAGGLLGYLGAHRQSASPQIERAGTVNVEG